MLIQKDKCIDQNRNFGLSRFIVFKTNPETDNAIYRRWGGGHFFYTKNNSKAYPKTYFLLLALQIFFAIQNIRSFVK